MAPAGQPAALGPASAAAAAASEAATGSAGQAPWQLSAQPTQKTLLGSLLPPTAASVMPMVTGTAPATAPGAPPQLGMPAIPVQRPGGAAAALRALGGVPSTAAAPHQPAAVGHTGHSAQQHRVSVPAGSPTAAGPAQLQGLLRPAQMASAAAAAAPAPAAAAQAAGAAAQTCGVVPPPRVTASAGVDVPVLPVAAVPQPKAPLTNLPDGLTPEQQGPRRNALEASYRFTFDSSSMMSRRPYVRTRVAALSSKWMVSSCGGVPGLRWCQCGRGPQ